MHPYDDISLHPQANLKPPVVVLHATATARCDACIVLVAFRSERLHLRQWRGGNRRIVPDKRRREMQVL